jgi:hypothetical protein
MSVYIYISPNYSIFLSPSSSAMFPGAHSNLHQTPNIPHALLPEKSYVILNFVGYSYQNDTNFVGQYHPFSWTISKYFAESYPLSVGQLEVLGYKSYSIG